MTNTKRKATLKASTARNVTRGDNLPNTLEASIQYVADLGAAKIAAEETAVQRMVDMGEEFRRATVKFGEKDMGKTKDEKLAIATRYVSAFFPSQPVKLADGKSNPAFSVKRSQLMSFANPAVIANVPDYSALDGVKGEKWLNCYNLNLKVIEMAKSGAAVAVTKKLAAETVQAVIDSKAEKKAEREAKAAKEAKRKLTPTQSAAASLTLLDQAFTALSVNRVKEAAIKAASFDAADIKALNRLMDKIADMKAEMDKAAK